MTTVDEMIAFIADVSGSDDITPDTDIFEDAGVTGDDFHEMIEEYSTKYSVDMSGYLWYFHTCEEGHHGLGGAFFPPPDKRVDRIPVTPTMLTNFANEGKWNIQYPAHEFPKRRYDILFNQVIFVVFLIIMAAIAIA